jgi:predicted TIM-barrel enzyme
VVGTAFKHDGYKWNAVDRSRVQAFMQKVRQIREAVAGRT